MTPQYAVVFRDMIEGVLSWRLWGRFGWQEVKRRYRRTALGPFWTTASLGIFVVSLGFIWANLWNQEPKQYLPYLASGMVTWVLTSTIITESCTMFVSAEGLIKQVRLNYSVLVLTLVWRNLIVFAHNLLIYVLIVIWAQVPITWATLLIFPGLAVLAINVSWISILVSTLCTRFRDVTQIINSFLQIIMFVTPIFYNRDALGPRMQFAAHYNFIFHLVDVVRAPLLGRAPEAWSWFFTLGVAVIGWMVTIYMFSRFRRRLAYWM